MYKRRTGRDKIPPFKEESFMGHLSDDDFRDLLGMGPVPKSPQLFRLNHCTCGGMVSGEGICYRCRTDHSVAMKAELLRRQAKVQKSQLSLEEFRAKLALVSAQGCHSCFYGTLDELGYCEVCEYSYADYHYDDIVRS